MANLKLGIFANLDLQGERIINLGTGVAGTDAVTVAQLTAATQAGAGFQQQPTTSGNIDIPANGGIINSQGTRAWLNISGATINVSFSAADSLFVAPDWLELTNVNPDTYPYENSSGNRVLDGVEIIETVTTASDFGGNVNHNIGQGVVAMLSIGDIIRFPDNATSPDDGYTVQAIPSVGVTTDRAVSATLNGERIFIYRYSQVSSTGEANQNAFSNIAVSGQTTVAADTATDSLTLVAGTGVAITTDATADSITITSTADGGIFTVVSIVSGTTSIPAGEGAILTSTGLAFLNVSSSAVSLSGETPATAFTDSQVWRRVGDGLFKLVTSTSGSITIAAGEGVVVESTGEMYINIGQFNQIFTNETPANAFTDTTRWRQAGGSSSRGADLSALTSNPLNYGVAVARPIGTDVTWENPVGQSFIGNVDDILRSTRFENISTTGTETNSLFPSILIEEVPVAIYNDWITADADTFPGFLVLQELVERGRNLVVEIDDSATVNGSTDQFRDVTATIIELAVPTVNNTSDNIVNGYSVTHNGVAAIATTDTAEWNVIEVADARRVLTHIVQHGDETLEVTTDMTVNRQLNVASINPSRDTGDPQFNVFTDEGEFTTTVIPVADTTTLRFSTADNTTIRDVFDGLGNGEGELFCTLQDTGIAAQTTITETGVGNIYRVTAAGLGGVTIERATLTDGSGFTEATGTNLAFTFFTGIQTTAGRVLFPGDVEFLGNVFGIDEAAIDQTYDATSTRAQSGTAVAEALVPKSDIDNVGAYEVASIDATYQDAASRNFGVVTNDFAANAFSFRADLPMDLSVDTVFTVETGIITFPGARADFQASEWVMAVRVPTSTDDPTIFGRVTQGTHTGNFGGDFVLNSTTLTGFTGGTEVDFFISPGISNIVANPLSTANFSIRVHEQYEGSVRILPGTRQAIEDIAGTGGTVPTSLADITGGFITSTGTNGSLFLRSDSDGVSDAPDLELYRNSPTPSAGDELGIVEFIGNAYNDSDVLQNADNGGDIPYASVWSEIVDPGGASSDFEGALYIRVADEATGSTGALSTDSLANIEITKDATEFRHNVVITDGANTLTLTPTTDLGGGGGGTVVITADNSNANSTAVPAGGIAILSGTSNQYYNVSGGDITVGVLADNTAAILYFENTNAGSWTRVGGAEETVNNAIEHLTLEALANVTENDVTGITTADFALRDTETAFLITTGSCNIYLSGDVRSEITIGDRFYPIINGTISADLYTVVNRVALDGANTEVFGAGTSQAFINLVVAANRGGNPFTGFYFLPDTITGWHEEGSVTFEGQLLIRNTTTNNWETLNEIPETITAGGGQVVGANPTLWEIDGSGNIMYNSIDLGLQAISQTGGTINNITFPVTDGEFYDEEVNANGYYYRLRIEVDSDNTTSTAIAYQTRLYAQNRNEGQGTHGNRPFTSPIITNDIASIGAARTQAITDWSNRTNTTITL